MELYLDSALITEIEEACTLGFLTGLTTTPTFMFREGIQDIDEMIRTRWLSLLAGLLPAVLLLVALQSVTLAQGGPGEPVPVEELDIAATAMRIALGELVKSIERPG